MSASALRIPADGREVAHPSLPERLVARAVAVTAAAVGTTVVAAVALSDAVHRRHRPPSPRNT